MSLPFQADHWLPGFNLNVEEWDATGQACQLGCEGIVSKRLGSAYRSGRSKHWVKNPAAPAAPAVRREAEEDWR